MVCTHQILDRITQIIPPLETVSHLQHLVPVVDDMCQCKNGVVDGIEILGHYNGITRISIQVFGSRHLCGV